MHVELLANNCDIKTRSFYNEKSGKQMTVHEQPCYLWMPGLPYPLPFSISISDPSQAYAPGNYVFTPESIRTNNFGNLEFNRFGMGLQRVNLNSENKPKAVNS